MRGLSAPGTADAVRESVAAMRKSVAQAVFHEGESWTGGLSEVARRLLQVGRVDLCLARLVEGHVDAVRILEQAGRAPHDGQLYGVWASRSAGTGVRAGAAAEGHRLQGELRFASGVDVVDRVLVPGWLDERTHLLFDVPADAVDADRTSWRTPAMDASRSFTVSMDLTVPEEPVGPANFYLDRPGFALGGLGVAAVWAGGARSVVDLVAHGLSAFEPSAHQLRRVGVMEQAAWEAQGALERALEAVRSADGAVDATVVGPARTAVVGACERILGEAGRVVGPAGLTTNGRLARTMADLAVYMRQHHVDLVLADLGRAALDRAEVAG